MARKRSRSQRPLRQPVVWAKSSGLLILTCWRRERRFVYWAVASEPNHRCGLQRFYVGIVTFVLRKHNAIVRLWLGAVAAGWIPPDILGETKVSQSLARRMTEASTATKLCGHFCNKVTKFIP